MSTTVLELRAWSIVADGEGILSADAMKHPGRWRFDAPRIKSTPQSRRAYRELCFTASGIAEYIGGEVLQDDTIRQHRGGHQEDVPAAQRAFSNRARCDATAVVDRYSPENERT